VRVPGPQGFWSTASWLRAAFAGLHYEVHHTLGEGDLLAVNATMCGTHTAPWVVYTRDGHVDTVFPPTGKSFRATASHWFRLQNAHRGALGEPRRPRHGPAAGLGSPTPVFPLRMASAKRQARRRG
jgi:hypothetical protein